MHAPDSVRFDAYNMILYPGPTALQLRLRDLGKLHPYNRLLPALFESEVSCMHLKVCCMHNMLSWPWRAPGCVKNTKYEV